MELILMRHGKALNVGAPGIHRDADRPLSDEGRATVREVARALKALGPRPELILTSPLPRAAQTAALVADTLGVQVEPCSALALGADPAEVADAVRHHPRDCLMLVGHMPDLAELAGHWIGATASAGLAFKKAGMALITFEGHPRAGSGLLEWLVPPRVWRVKMDG